MDFLRDLNNKQRRAVEDGDGPVLIVAGPGTGKTKTLTARIAYLLDSGEAKANDILALTFTVKAAREVQERVAALITTKKLPLVSTFHALGYNILRTQQGIKEHRFASDAERLDIIRNLPRPTLLKGVSVRELALRLSRAKGSLHGSNIEDFVGAYNDELQSHGWLDFDDLVSRTYTLLQSDTALRAKQQKYRYILVDEFQDTSELQWELIKLLRCNENIFVIGDPNQSIYSFRGAGGDMFKRFRAEFPGRKEVTLETNYRSARRIVSLANAIFPSSVPLQPFASEDGRVQAIETLNEYSEADLVLSAIEQGIGGSDMLKASVDSEGRRFKDFAILYRTHRVAKAVQRRLHDSGIPYQIVGEGSPYDQPEVQAVIHSLQWLHDHETLPKAAGFTSGQLQALLEKVGMDKPVSKIAEQVILVLGLEAEDIAKRQRLGQLVSTLVRFDESGDGLRKSLEYFTSIAENEFYDPTVDVVTLLTIHASKGLEFTHVFLIAAEEGILPNIKRSGEVNLDEERRLFYVAATRAKQQLDVLFTKKRSGDATALSRFIADLNEHVLPRTTDPDLAQLEKKLAKRQQKARQITLF